jgi:hypothetical protein
MVNGENFEMKNEKFEINKINKICSNLFTKFFALHSLLLRRGGGCEVGEN